MGEKILHGEKDGIASIDDAKDFLYYRLADSKTKLFSGEDGLIRSKKWLKLLGDPQENFKSVHIAGTSGKSSTCYILSSILNTKFKVGTTVSPHVYDVRERMMINLQYIDANEFTDMVKGIILKIAELENSSIGRPTYFEVMNGLATQLFSNANVGYGVIETGIGGRYDITNTTGRNDKLAVITRLGLDHTEILGDTLADIAWQKGGIIPCNGQALALKPDSKVAQKVLQAIADEQNTTIQFVDPSTYITNVHESLNGIRFDYNSPSLAAKNIFLPLLGKYQLENTIMAIEAAKLLAKRDGWELSAENLLSGLKNVKIPGRAEVIEVNGTTIIIDSAHNPQKLKAFFSLIDSLKLKPQPIIIFGAKRGKDWQKSISLISKQADKLFVTEFFKDKPKNLSVYSVPTNHIVKEVKRQNGKVAGQYNSPVLALKDALASAKPDQIIIIVGSMYMLGELWACYK